MTETKDINMQDYVYDLPDERIAKYPLPERDKSKLLVYRHGHISESTFRDIAHELPRHTLLVRNNTRVIRARLLFQKETGARIEIFCLDPLHPTSYELALGSRLCCTWHCMLGNAKRWAIDSPALTRSISTEQGDVTIYAKRVAHDQVAFTWDNESFTFGELLEQMGILPIPPYLNRETEQTDLQTYQTVYAKHKGSVAAPTAGLHFTPHVFEQLAQSDVPVLDITLHVGADTFKPVKSATIGEHEMHRELVIISAEVIGQLLQSGRSITAVGTTSVRSLESLYWLAVRLMRRPRQSPEQLEVTQWESYEQTSPLPTRAEALGYVLRWMQEQELEQIIFPTGILIAPGYTFRVVDAIVTNFHQPHSTLLLLISAFIGDDWHQVYDYALKHDFRFLSYGDSSLLIP